MANVNPNGPDGNHGLHTGVAFWLFEGKWIAASAFTMGLYYSKAVEDAWQAELAKQIMSP